MGKETRYDSLFGPSFISIQECYRLLKRFRKEVFLAIEGYDLLDEKQGLELIRQMIAQLERLEESLVKARTYIGSLIKKMRLDPDKLFPSKFRYSVFFAYLRIAEKKARKSHKIARMLGSELNLALKKRKPLTKRKFQIKFLSHCVALDKSISICLTSLRDAIKRFGILELVKNNKIEHGFDKKKLVKGDILLSYKTDTFLKKHYISYIISRVEKSRITHSSVIYSNKDGYAKMITASGYSRKISIEDATPHEGELLLVMRPKLTKKQRQTINKLLDALAKEVKEEGDEYLFSYLKFYVAGFIGLLSQVMIRIMRRAVLLPNPIQEKKRYFCSDLLDRIFKYAGIYLTPRSEYDSLVGPTEFLYSPYLDLIGVVCLPTDKKELKKMSIS